MLGSHRLALKFGFYLEKDDIFFFFFLVVEWSGHCNLADMGINIYALASSLLVIIGRDEFLPLSYLSLDFSLNSCTQAI